MGNWFSRATGESQAHCLHDAVCQARAGGERAIEALAAARAPGNRCGGHPGLVYLDPASARPRAIPAALFHRHYRLRVEALELTLYGYCARRAFGWERREEVVLSLRRPPFWRRLLRPCPLIACTFTCGPGGAAIVFRPAQRRGHVATLDHIVRLDCEMQEQLSRLHAEQLAARAPAWRIAAWFSKLRAK